MLMRCYLLILLCAFHLQRWPPKDRYGAGLSGRERRCDDRDRSSSPRAEAGFPTESLEGGPAAGTGTQGEFVRWENLLSEITYTLEDESAIRRSNRLETTNEKVQDDSREDLGTFHSMV